MCNISVKNLPKKIDNYEIIMRERGLKIIYGPPHPLFWDVQGLKKIELFEIELSVYRNSRTWNIYHI